MEGVGSYGSDTCHGSRTYGDVSSEGLGREGIESPMGPVGVRTLGDTGHTGDPRGHVLLHPVSLIQVNGSYR